MSTIPANYDLHNLPDPRDLFDLIEVCVPLGIRRQQLHACTRSLRQPGTHTHTPSLCFLPPSQATHAHWPNNQVVGTGTYGEVFKARHKRTGELTAIKVLDLIEVPTPTRARSLHRPLMNCLRER